MISAMPWIRYDTSFVQILPQSGSEAEAFRFVDQNLAPFTWVSIVIRGDTDSFKTSEIWKKVEELEVKLANVPGVHTTESLFPFLKRLYGTLADKDTSQNDIFADTRTIPQLLALVRLGVHGQQFLRHYLSADHSTLHIPVRLNRLDSNGLLKTLNTLRIVAENEFEGLARVFVTGHIALAARQSQALVKSQVQSLCLALLVITILMIIQLRSIFLGLISLIPNLVPLAVIFGTMSWSGISLSSMTIFSVVFSYGLSVDDTIHYLTQFKRELASKRRTMPVSKCLEGAYDATARALIATSVVFFFAFLTLLLSPFAPTANFGLLCALAVVGALLGDLAFMPSVILSSRTVRLLLGDQVKENAPLEQNGGSFI
jgi:predicted RND superfamily exporter protein